MSWRSLHIHPNEKHQKRYSQVLKLAWEYRSDITTRGVVIHSLASAVSLSSGRVNTWWWLASEKL